MKHFLKVFCVLVSKRFVGLFSSFKLRPSYKQFHTTSSNFQNKCLSSICLISQFTKGQIFECISIFQSFAVALFSYIKNGKRFIKNFYMVGNIVIMHFGDGHWSYSWNLSQPDWFWQRLPRKLSNRWHDPERGSFEIAFWWWTRIGKTRRLPER